MTTRSTKKKSCRHTRLVGQGLNTDGSEILRKCLNCNNVIKITSKGMEIISIPKKH